MANGGAPVHPDAIETLVGLGEIEEAAALTAELEEYGRRLDRPWGLATAARSAALIASARGAVDEALEAAERALVEHERLEWPFERARTLLVRKRSSGDSAVAGTLLRRWPRRLGFRLVRNPLWLARPRPRHEDSAVAGARATSSPPPRNAWQSWQPRGCETRRSRRFCT